MTDMPYPPAESIDWAKLIRSMRVQNLSPADSRFILTTLGVWDQFVELGRRIQKEESDHA